MADRRQQADVFEESNILKSVWTDTIATIFLAVVFSHTVTRLKYEEALPQDEKILYYFASVGSFLAGSLLLYRLSVRAMRDKMVRRIDLDAMQFLADVQVGEAVTVQTREGRTREPRRRDTRRPRRPARRAAPSKRKKNS